MSWRRTQVGKDVFVPVRVVERANKGSGSEGRR